MKPQIDQIISLPIHGLGSSGEGVGYFNGYTVFVDGALSGEVIEAKLFQCQKRFGRAELLKITTPSPDRVTPPCKFFGECGGCQLMHLSYAKQLEVKRQRVVDAMQRIAKFECRVEACLPSPNHFEYRNKIQLPVRKKGDGIALGLYARASHNLVEIDHCLIHCPLGEEAYKCVRSIVKESGIAAYEPETGLGELRHVLIKSALRSSEVLVILVTNQKASSTLAHLAQKIMASNSAIKGVVHNLQSERDNVILGEMYEVLEGRGYIHEQLNGLTFKISPASFFQVNPSQAESLYAKALEFAELGGAENVLDAYCGVGTLSLIFAKKTKKVIGVECVPEAIADAQENAKLNHIANAEFVCAPVEKYISTAPHIDTLLLNPPRKGCELAFLEGIKKLKTHRIVYISCDPATLARDLAILHQFGYSIDLIQPYDMFPQTAHVECVAKLTLNV